MNIVFLTRRFWPEIGGVERHVLEISKRLARKGYKITVITEEPKTSSSNGNQSKKGSARLMGETEGVKIIRIDSGREDWFKKFRVWQELLKQKKVLKDADIIHCHDVFYWYLPFRFLYPKKKVFVTFHGYEGNEIPGIKAKISHKIAEKLSKGNICIGGFYQKWYGTKPTIISYGATDFQGPKMTRNKEYKEITFVGRLEEETGIMEYLEALWKIGSAEKIKLKVLGDGKLRKQAERFCKKNNINAEFYGFVSNVAQYIKKTDYVFVSRYLGILESLVLRKPVFAVYNNAIKKDYLEMTPFKDFINIEKNAKEIFLDLEKKSSPKKIEDGYKWAINQSWDKLVGDYTRLWRIN